MAERPVSGQHVDKVEGHVEGGHHRVRNTQVHCGRKQEKNDVF